MRLYVVEEKGGCSTECTYQKKKPPPPKPPDGETKRKEEKEQGREDIQIHIVEALGLFMAPPRTGRRPCDYE